MSDEIAISVQNLTKIYKLYNSPQDRLKEALNPFRKKYHRDFHALSDVSFEVKKGETVGIIGQNGAGKSTLLKILTGVISPSSGNVQVNGRISALLELGAGFNPQISGIENVYFNGTIMGFTREEMDAKLDDILSFADIGDFIYQPVKIYSSGMFVRLAFAVAVHIEPEILIIDEALSVGDVMFQSKCFDKIKTLMNGGTTTLFVTHNMNTVQTLCDSAFILNGGKIYSEGKPKDVTFAYYQMQRELEHARQKKEVPKPTNPVQPQVVSRQPDPTRALTQEGEQRLGIQTAKIVDFRIYNDQEIETLALETGKPFTVWMKILFDGDVINPAVGAMIRNPQGQNLLGIHSYHERRMVLGEKHKGDVLCVSFTSDMLLNPGKYTLSLLIADHVTDLEYTSIDSRNSIAVLDVFGKEFSYGMIHNNGSVLVE